MHFLSSKVVHQLETAFDCILDSQRVKEGEMRLEKLRKEEKFELGLATFISRSQVYHQRLLAVLQLQKQLVISDGQTAWSLRQVYFRDSDKIAHKICKLITARDNIRLASEFLKVDPNQSGLSIYRQIQIVFNLLNHPDKALLAVQHHLTLLYDYFVSIVKILQCEDQCFFMLMVCLALFYSSLARCHVSQPERLVSHWNQIQQKCMSCAVDSTSLIVQTINKTIMSTPTATFKPYAFSSFLKAIFQSISRNNTIKLHYQSKALELIIQNNDLLSLPSLRQELMEGLKFQNFNKISNILSNFKIYGQIEIEFDNDIELQNKSQNLVRQLCNKLIQDLFASCYDWLRQQHLPAYRTSIEALQSFLSVINYYNSTKIIPLNESVSLITQVFNVLQEQTGNAPKDIDQAYIIQMVTLIQFLTKFKSSIEISLLPSVVSALMQKRQMIEALSPFCDAFLSGIWKQVTFMQTNELIDFVDFQLQQTNSNLWTVSFKSYEFFLHIALYLEQSLNYFSTCDSRDSLLCHFLDSHQIICQIIAENSEAKINFELFQMLLQLSACIIENKSLKSTPEVINRLSLPLLVSKIEEHLLLSDVSATIIAFNLYQSHELLHQIQEESAEWRIDELDYSYRIQLYLKYVEYATEFLPSKEIDHLTRNLGIKIIDFLKSMNIKQLNKFKETRLWEKIQLIYNVRAYVSYRMEIQFS